MKPKIKNMERVEVMNWVVNILIFSLPFSWYMCYQMYKDLKKKDKIIALQNEILQNMLKEHKEDDDDGFVVISSTSEPFQESNEDFKERINKMLIKR